MAPKREYQLEAKFFKKFQHLLFGEDLRWEEDEYVMFVRAYSPNFMCSCYYNFFLNAQTEKERFLFHDVKTAMHQCLHAKQKLLMV